MKKIYAVATESDVVLAFESRSDADEYAGEHDGMAVLPVPCVGAVRVPRARSRPPTGTESPTLCRREASRHEAVHVRMRTLRQGGAGDPGGLRQDGAEEQRANRRQGKGLVLPECAESLRAWFLAGAVKPEGRE